MRDFLTGSYSESQKKFSRSAALSSGAVLQSSSMLQGSETSRLARSREIQSAILECARSGSFNRQTYSSARAVIAPDGGPALPIKSDQLNRFDDSTPSFLALNGVGSSHVTGATYWALFVAAEGAGQNPLACESFERAHAMQARSQRPQGQ